MEGTIRGGGGGGREGEKGRGKGESELKKEKEKQKQKQKEEVEEEQDWEEEITREKTLYPPWNSPTATGTPPRQKVKAKGDPRAHLQRILPRKLDRDLVFVTGVQSSPPSPTE